MEQASFSYPLAALYVQNHYLSYMKPQSIYNNLQMLKINEKTSSEPICQRHSFSLKPLDSSIKQPIILQAQFCEQKGKTFSNNQSNGSNKCSINCACFNEDRDFHTKAFVLTHQNNAYNQSIAEPNKFKHQNQLDYYSQEQRSQLYMAKPDSKNNYCSVCRTTFQDYRTHIDRIEHRHKIRTSPFNSHINRLALKYNKANRVPRSKKTLKRAKKQTVINISDSEGQENIKYPTNKARNTQIPLEYCQNRWRQEQIPIDYAKMLVNTFRGIPHQQIMLNYNYLAYFSSSLSNAFPSAFNHCLRSNQPPANKSISKEEVRKFTYIIIDQ